ncbi:tetratricopeptide repeat protein [Lignipirellula cremea]|uniref:Tol-pal system protein YbgF n=1 Tax=Lignipirellula cremea TaxID=2528010 RepID=A0A518DM88_9BACT|nr:tetratricopeptide repeat protein [Lignipirellula cremea]QDU92958.1 tol-pal system protein YbgF [Lignipirellula cremea]
MRLTAFFSFLLCLGLFLSVHSAVAQDAPRSSLIEDRAARKLMEAGDGRYDVEEFKKAVEVWQSVIERYPLSKVRFDAHMRLGTYFLERDRSYERARVHFDVVASEENRDEEQRAVATLKLGVCYYQDRNYGKCFSVMRDIIERFPVSPQVNQAYYYIGLGHFQLGHYSRAIAALEKVGTTLGESDSGIEKLEAGKRLFVKIEDADLAVLQQGEAIEITCTSTGGDEEKLQCYSVGRNVRVVLGSLPTRLGSPQAGNGFLEVKGGDQVKVSYTDRHTADKKVNEVVLKEVAVVGNARVQITDGAFGETLRGVVLGKQVNIQIGDADGDLTANVDQITAVAEVYRRKTDEEVETETAALIASGQSEIDPEDSGAGPEGIVVDPYKRIDRVEIKLTETDQPVGNAQINGLQSPVKDEDEAADGDDAAASAAETPAAAEATDPAAPQDPAPGAVADPGAIHTGVFRTSIALEKNETPNEQDDVLQAVPGDMVRIIYFDEKFRGEGSRDVIAQARCLEGNIGAVRVTRAVISDDELRVKTQLKTASALTNIGNRYKEFGLKSHAEEKYQTALEVCEEIMEEARQLGGRTLEETYVQLWQIYFQMDRLELAAAMAQRLQREFPNSGFVDDALLQLADVARKEGDLNRAIGIYNRLVRMEGSLLRGEAQFGIASCYEQMAENSPNSTTQMQDRAFQEYKKVFDNFPDSGRVGEAVAKMANHYYHQKDYGRAIDTFESVLATHPDAKFLDVILFNYGRCLYRMGRRAEASQRFNQLIGEFPESPLATDAKKISEALSRAGS